jgi:hypothetical protein
MSLEKSNAASASCGEEREMTDTDEKRPVQRSRLGDELVCPMIVENWVFFEGKLPERD